MEVGVAYPLGLKDWSGAELPAALLHQSLTELHVLQYCPDRRPSSSARLQSSIVCL